MRELRNVVIQAAVAARTYEIGVGDLPPLQAAGPGTRAGVGMRAGRSALELSCLEKDAILAALHETGGHQQRAANLLGVSRRTLSRKLRSYCAEADLEEDCAHAV